MWIASLREQQKYPELSLSAASALSAVKGILVFPGLLRIRKGKLWAIKVKAFINNTARKRTALLAVTREDHKGAFSSYRYKRKHGKISYHNIMKKLKASNRPTRSLLR